MKLSALSPDLQFAWACGFFEGEGNFHYGTKTRFRRATVTQNDKALLETFRDIVGYGKVYGPVGRKSGNDYYRWYLGTWNELIDLIERMTPYLSDRRLEQAQRILDNPPQYASYRGRTFQTVTGDHDASA